MALIPVKDLGASGWMPDQEGYELPDNGFTSLTNARMVRGWAERVSGYYQVFDNTAVIPYGLFPHSSATIDYIVHCGLAKVYVDDGTTRTEITGSAPTGTVSDKWTGGTLGGLLCLNNGVDKPMFWDNNTANNLATLTGWDANHLCKALRPFKQFLIALAPTKSSTAYPHTVMWSDSAEPGAIPTEWTPTATNDAGESPALAETPDLIVDGLPLGDTFVVYKERSMYGMQYIGGNDIFRFWRLPGDSGALARNCVASTPLGHVVLTQGDVIMHNGQGPRSIVDGRARKWLFDNIDTTNYERSCVVTHSERQEVWICFPETGQTWCTKALVWHWPADTISVRNLPNVTSACFGAVVVGGAAWSSLSTVWSDLSLTWADLGGIAPVQASMFIATSGSKIHKVDVGDTENGSDYTATIERTGLHLGSPDKVKICRGVWPKIDGNTGDTVTVQIGASMDPSSDPTWSAAQTFTIGTSVKIDSFATGRYLSYRLTTTGDKPWRVRSIDFDIVVQGAF